MKTSIMVVNGESVPSNMNGISAADRGFSLGDGVFETLKVKNYLPIWFDEHLARLEASASFAGIPFTRAKKGKRDCQQVIEKNDIRNGFVRMTLTRGGTSTGSIGETPEAETFAVSGLPREDKEAPLKVSFASWPVNEKDPSVSHKTTSRFSAVMARREAAAKGLDELLFLNTAGYAAEGTVSNIFFVAGGILKTPSAECGIIKGITRGKVLESARRLGIRSEEGLYTPAEIEAAEEIFFTNSGILAAPCVEFSGRPLPTGKVTASIRRELQNHLG